MKRQAILDGLVKIVPPLVERKFKRKDTCVVSTAIAIDVLGRFGFKATPMACYSGGLNDVAVGYFVRNEIPDPMPDDLWARGCCRESCQATDHFGHLVARQEDTILDLTAGQWSRPDQGIDIPTAWHLPYHPGPFAVPVHAGALYYQMRPECESFRDSDWWTDRSLRQDIVETTVARLTPKTKRRRRLPCRSHARA